MLSQPIRRCSLCKTDKTPADFWTNGPKIRSWCKQCCYEKNTEWRQKNSERIHHYNKKHSGRDRRLKDRYGMTQQQYDEMYANQDGKCAICGREDTLVIDHEHRTGKVRALLCNPCNRTLGSAGEDISVLEKAIAYLRIHA